MCVSVWPHQFPPAQPINNGRSLTSTLSKYETYYSVTYLYFSSINNVCAILALENYDWFIAYNISCNTSTNVKIFIYYKHRVQRDKCWLILVYVLFHLLIVFIISVPLFTAKLVPWPCKGRACSACKSRAQKRGRGQLGQEIHILHVNII